MLPFIYPKLERATLVLTKRLLTGALLVLLTLPAFGARKTFPLMADWGFHAGALSGPEAAAQTRMEWASVDLPHDWSIGTARNEAAPSAGGGGFFPTGEGWYRKEMDVPEHWKGRSIILHFEGVTGNTTAWVNGEQVGSNHNDYLPFRIDLSQYVHFGRTNTLLLRVDNSDQPASRWYTGSGIYRPVRLEVVEPVHVRHDSLFVSAMDLYDVAATMNVEVDVVNGGAAPVTARVKVFLASPDGLPVARSEKEFEIQSGGLARYAPQLAIPHPQFWNPDTPVLYRAIVQVFVDGRLTDRVEDSFGIRSIEFNAGAGFLLNGKPVLLNGANIHHDYGPLGAAAHGDAVLRKVRMIKEAGFNAVRTAHNPPSPAFLKACDELGLLVVNEAFDAWAIAKAKRDYHKHFAGHWRGDLRHFVERDRNHPSVIMWSIGNEMYERGNPEAVRIAAEMAGLVRMLDPTRPVTAGLNGLGKTRDWSELDPLFAELDVAGYNYELPRHAADHGRVPERIVYASESYTRDIFRNREIIREHDYVVGEFVWSGMDYLGEAGIGRLFPEGSEEVPHWEGSHFPYHGALTGEIDLIGQRRPVSHYRNIVWDAGEKLYMAVRIPGNPVASNWAVPPLKASWTWPGREGETLNVEVFSRYPLVRLFSGFDLVGEMKMSRENGYRAVFDVPYEPGILKVQGLENGEVMETMVLRTASPAAAIELKPDSTSGVAGISELVFVEVKVVDGAGRPHPNADHAILYEVTGPAVIAGIGSSDLSTEAAYLANPRRVHEGRALLALRSTGEPGNVSVRATAEGLMEDSIRIEFRQYP